MFVFAVMLRSFTQHKQWSKPVFIFSFHGSPSPTSGNKDKMGGSAFFAKSETCSMGLRAKKHNQTIG